MTDATASLPLCMCCGRLSCYHRSQTGGVLDFSESVFMVSACIQYKCNTVSYGFILYVPFSWHTVGQRIFAVAAELMRI